MLCNFLLGANPLPYCLVIGIPFNGALLLGPVFFVRYTKRHQSTPKSTPEIIKQRPKYFIGSSKFQIPF